MTKKAYKLRQCLSLLNSVADCLDEIGDCENAETLDLVIGDLKQNLAVEENSGTQLIQYKDGKFICKNLSNTLTFKS